jgi:hypothetical protein
MSKDIVYIDVDDDITAVVGKIKSSKHAEVALVPPKRIGMLQSAVNLRLLMRQAERYHKKLSIISSNPIVIALAGNARIPIAKNLQSSPELAQIDALEIDDGEDVIDGAKMPIGKLVNVSDHSTDKKISMSDAVDSVDIEIDSDKPVALDTKKRLPKIPNFSSFRLKIFAVLLILPFVVWFFAWANIQAPFATIIITAKTTPAPVSTTVKLGGETPTDVSKNTIQTLTKTLSRDASIDFTATGEADLGEKAAGTITVRNCDYSSGFTLAAGTRFTGGNGSVYLSNAAVTVPGFSGSSSSCTLSGSASGKSTVSVTAVGSGEAHNNSGQYYDIQGIGATEKVDAIGGTMAGGTTRLTTVVTSSDIQKATDALKALSTEADRRQLTAQYENGEYVIEGSFGVLYENIKSSPEVDKEASTKKATLTAKVTYSLIAITKPEMENFLKESIAKQISDASKQKIYSDGIEKVVLSGYFKSDSTTTINISTIGRIGPTIDVQAVKDTSKGKRYGDVQAELERLSGVSSVDVDFSYFWVSTVPNDDSKIQVDFNLSDD